MASVLILRPPIWVSLVVVEYYIFFRETDEIFHVWILLYCYFIDAVVWNPWDKRAKAISDFGDEEYKYMLCVEAAAIEKPITLKPGEEWRGRLELSAVPSSYCSGQLDPQKVLHGIWKIHHSVLLHMYQVLFWVSSLQYVFYFLCFIMSVNIFSESCSSNKKKKRWN